MEDISFLKHEVIKGLVLELSLYLAAADNVSSRPSRVVESPQVRPWSNAFKLISCHLLLQRAFSFLASSFAQQQESSLEEYIQLLVMLQYSSRV